MEPEILAHRTAMIDAPPNSLKGLEYCVSHGVRQIECDVTFVKGEPFIWSTNDNSFLDDAEKAALRLATNFLKEINRTDCSEKIMGIDGVFDFLRRNDGVRIYFDVNDYSSDLMRQTRSIPEHVIGWVFDRIILPAKKAGLCEKIGFVTFNGGLDLLRAAKSTDLGIATNLIIPSPWGQIPENCLSSITIGWKFINWWQFFYGSFGKLLDSARKQRLQVYAGLANKASEVVWLTENEVNGIWTDSIVRCALALNDLKLSEL